jgi:hypothetical protein
MQAMSDCQSLISTTHTLTGGIGFSAAPSNKRVFWNVEQKRWSPCRSALGMAIDHVGLNSSCVPWKPELLPRTLAHGACDVELCRGKVEELAAFLRAQYDAVKSRIACQKWKNLLKYPCNASALSTE